MTHENSSLRSWQERGAATRAAMLQREWGGGELKSCLQGNYGFLNSPCTSAPEIWVG